MYEKGNYDEAVELQPKNNYRASLTMQLHWTSCRTLTALLLRTTKQGSGRIPIAPMTCDMSRIITNTLACSGYTMLSEGPLLYFNAVHPTDYSSYVATFREEAGNARSTGADVEG